MRKYRYLILAVAAIATATFLARGSSAVSVPDPTVDEDRAAAKGKRTAVLAAGCFWGVEAVFEKLNGVDKVVAGFSGGDASSANYETVSEGRTGHAESVEITYDPAKISYGQILKVFFSVAHDPTQKDRQGPDWGHQYRSAIFYKGDEQKKIAEAYVAQLEQAKTFRGKIATEVSSLKGFYRAEEYHQHFVDRNPHNPYVMVNDIPKVENLKKQFPELVKK